RYADVTLLARSVTATIPRRVLGQAWLEGHCGGTMAKEVRRWRSCHELVARTTQKHTLRPACRRTGGIGAVSPPLAGAAWRFRDAARFTGVLISRNAMFLVEHHRYGATYLVFTYEDPQKDGYKGNVEEGISLDYDMEAV